MLPGKGIGLVKTQPWFSCKGRDVPGDVRHRLGTPGGPQPAQHPCPCCIPALSPITMWEPRPCSSTTQGPAPLVWDKHQTWDEVGNLQGASRGRVSRHGSAVNHQLVRFEFAQPGTAPAMFEGQRFVMISGE